MDYKKYYESLKKVEKNIELGRKIETTAEIIEDFGNFHIGKIEIVNKIPEYINENKLVDYVHAPYDSRNCSNDYYVIKSTGLHNADTEIRVYATKGYKFSDEEKEFLDIYITYIFLYSSRKKVLEVIENASYIDSLTNALNLSGLKKYSESIKNIFDDYCVIYSNIKNFKYYNQIFDRANADLVLREYCKQLLSSIELDERISRPSGDRFISVIKKDNVDKYLNVLSSVKVSVNDRDLKLESYIGYCDLENGCDFMDCVENANTALNIKKRDNYGNSLKFTDRMKQDMINESTALNEINDALINKEFINFYQPKVNSESATLVGAEALVRWKKEDKILPPRVFIETLENNNKIIELDFNILHNACEDILSWINNGINPVRISVNFSMKHLDNENTADRIIGIIDSYGIDHSLFEVELTEITNSKDIEKMQYFIKKLQEENISVAMDDFASGYASLNMLNKLNYNVVKLDKSMVDGIIDSNESSRIIIKHVIPMLNELGVDIIAEGVETYEQLELLYNYGCKKIQGYYFDKPLSYSEFNDRLITKKYLKK